jgi:hypothetical protein
MEKLKKEATVELFDAIKGFEDIYPDDTDDSAYEDDCFIHVIRNRQRIVFYNGQGSGAYGENDIKRFENIVDKILKKEDK